MANKKVSQLTSKPSVLVTDLFPIADPSTGQLYKTTISDLGTAIGSGVSSVNGLVGAVVLDTDDIQELVSPTNKWFTDTRARAALSASSPLAYNNGTGVFSIPAATSSQNGYLTSTDWTTFNSKQAALSGTGFVKISGTTISYDNSTYLTTSSAASTYLALSGGTLTGALNGTSATFTGDLTISSTNPRIYLTDTDNNPDYFISNTDGTFTIYDVTNSTSRFTIGTTGNATFTKDLQLTGGNLILPSNNTVGGTNYYIGQTMATSDNWKIYGYSVASDKGELVFEVGDNGFDFEPAGNRFRFWINGITNPKDLAIFDYTDSIFYTTLTANSFIKSGGTSSQFLKADGSVDSSTYLTTSSASSTYLPLSGGTLTGNLSITKDNPKIFLNDNAGGSQNNYSFSNNFGTFNLNDETAGGTSVFSYGGGLFNFTGTTTFSTINATNSATFSSSVQASSFNIAANGTIASNSFWGTLHTKGSGSYSDWSIINSGGSGIMWNPTGTSNMAFGSLGTGLVYSNSGILTSTNPSDSRLKSNIKTITYGLNDILKLRPVSYNWKDDKVKQGIQFGFIAQEVQEVMPDSVKEFGEETKFLGLEKDAIYATLINAIKELKAELDTLKNK